MKYDIERKELNGVELSKREWQIFEIVLESGSEPIGISQIADMIAEKYYLTGINNNITDETAARQQINIVNKKIGGEEKVIKNKRGVGYYIDMHIEII